MKCCMTIVKVSVLMAVCVLMSAPVGAQPDRKLTLKQIMTNLHKGKAPIKMSIDNQLKSAEPDWDLVQKQTRQYRETIETIEGKDPKKGDKEAFARLVKAYIDEAKALEAAADKKDKAACVEVNDRMIKACTNCHKAHK